MVGIIGGSKYRTIRLLLLHLAAFCSWSVFCAPGDLKWEINFGGCILDAPSVATNGNLLVSSCDGVVHSVTSDGSNVWSAPTSGYGSFANPVVAGDGTIYLRSGSRLFALSPDGVERWELPVLPRVPLNDGLSVGPDGVVYLSNGKNTLMAVNPDGTTRWQLNGQFVGVPVTGPDGVVFVPSESSDFTSVNPDGSVCSLTNLSGSLKAVALRSDGTALVALTSWIGSKAVVQALTPSDGTSWQFEYGARLAGSPIIGPDESVYYAFDDGRVVALNANGQLKWDYFMGGTNTPSRVATTPALASDGTLYFTGEHYLHALDSDGQLLWRFDGGSNVLGAPLVGADGTVYVCGSSGALFAVEGTGAGLAGAEWPMYHGNARHQASVAGSLVSPPAPAGISASYTNFTDRILITWTSAPPATHYTLYRGETPVYADAQELTNHFTGGVSFEDRSAIPGVTYYYFVRAENAAGQSSVVGPTQGQRRVAGVGEPVWIFSGEDSLNAPAVELDGTVIVTSSKGNVYAVNSNGLPAWKYIVGDAVCSAPSIAEDGTIYFTAASTHASVALNAVFALHPTGQLFWEKSTDAYSEMASSSGVAIGSDGTIYVAEGDYAVPENRRVMAFTPSGSNVWNFANGRDFRLIPTVGADGTIYVCTRDSIMEALRPDGTLLWEFNSGDGLGSPVITAQGVLLIAGTQFHAINPDGLGLWSYPLQNGASAGASCLDAGGVLFAQGDYAYYTINDDGTGATKHTLPVSGSTLVHVVRDSAGNVYVSSYGQSSSAISAIGSAGQTQWTYILNGDTFGDPTLGTNNMLYVPTSNGKLYAFRTAAGLDSTAWPHPFHDPQHTSRATQTPPAPPAPSDVSATLRTRVTDVRVSWSPALGASAYEIFRSVTTNQSDATLLISVTGQSFYDDFSAEPEIAYTYWIRASNIGGKSPFSAASTGVRRQAQPGEQLYEWTLYGDISTAPAIADDGTVYVSVNLPVLNAPDAGRKVVAVRPDGSIQWQYLTGKATLGSPSIASDGTVYVATESSLNGASPSPLLALNPDGTQRWEFMADNLLQADPVIAQDGTVYVGSANGTLYAVSPEGQSLWSTNIGSAIGSLAVARDRTIYVLAFDGHLYAVASSGSKIWETDVGAIQLSGSLAITAEGDICLAARNGGLKLFAPDGTLKRQISSINLSATPVIGTNGSMIIGDSAGILHILDPSNTNAWSSTNSGGGFWAAGAVSSEGAIYAGNNARRLLAVSHSAATLWEYDAESGLNSSPAIGSDGTIYIGTSGGKLISIFGGSGLADTPWPMYQRDARHTGCDTTPATFPGFVTNVAASVGSFNDKIRVSWDLAPGAAYYQVWRNVQSNVNSAVLIAGCVGGQDFYDDTGATPGTNYFYWIRPANGVGLGDFSQAHVGFRRIALPGEYLGDSMPWDAAGTSPSLGVDGTIYVGSVSGRKLYAFTPVLTKLWEFTYGAPSTAAVGDDGEIYAWILNGRFYGLNTNGTSDWWFPGSYATHLPPAITASGTLIVADRNQTVSCYDPIGKSYLWQYPAGSAISAAPAIGADGAIYFGTQDGQLHALNADGSLRWRFQVGGSIQSSPAVGTDGVVYFGCDDRGIYAVGPDGTLRWANQAGGIVSASPVIAPNGTIIVGSQDGKLYAFSLEGEKRWDFTADSAVYGSACVGTDGMVYFASYNAWIYGLNSQGQRVWSVNSATNGLTGHVYESPLLLDDRLLVPVNSYFDGGLEALSVPAGPASVNWSQYRHDARRTARASGWLTLTPLSPPGRVAGESVSVSAGFGLADRTIEQLELLSGTNIVSRTNGSAVAITWTDATAGTHLLTLRAIDSDGNVHVSPVWTLTIAPPPVLSISMEPGKMRLNLNAIVGRQYQLEVQHESQ